MRLGSAAVWDFRFGKMASNIPESLRLEIRMGLAVRSIQMVVSMWERS